MSAVTEPRAARGPGRPPSDAPERISVAALEVLKRDGYAGLTTAKVAAASGQNKALISYYFGSKRGLVAAVARRVSQTISDEILSDLGSPRRAEELVDGLAAGVQRVFERDEGLQRVYFDLASQSVVDPDVGEILAEMKSEHRAILRELLLGLDRPPPAADLDGIVVFLVAGLEGLSLEQIERGETPALAGARRLFISGATAAIGG